MNRQPKQAQERISHAATSVEGSGWAALVYCGHTNRPLIMQIEKHNVNVNPQQKILFSLSGL